MARVKVRLDGTKRLIDQLPASVNRKISKVAAETILQEMQSRIARGYSPIEGKGRFPKYKNPKKYPGDRKPKSPVNLYLSGKFLNQLRAQVSPVQGKILIGFWSDYGKKLESGHREGVNKQPKRPIIPADGERFTRPIRELILKLYQKAVREYLSKR